MRQINWWSIFITWRFGHWFNVETIIINILECAWIMKFRASNIRFGQMKKKKLSKFLIF